MFVSTESTSFHEFVSQFDLEFFIHEKYAYATVHLNSISATPILSAVMVERHQPYVTNYTDVHDQSNGNNDSLFLHGLKSFGLGIIT